MRASETDALRNMISLLFIIVAALLVGLILFLRLILSPLPVGGEIDPRRRWRKCFASRSRFSAAG